MYKAMDEFSGHPLEPSKKIKVVLKSRPDWDADKFNDEIIGYADDLAYDLNNSEENDRTAYYIDVNKVDDNKWEAEVSWSTDLPNVFEEMLQNPCRYDTESE